MEQFFLTLLNMSITAGWIALVVMLLRLLLKKAPKWMMGILWAFVAIRLICPFSLESVLSLIPSAETIPTNIATSETPEIHSGFSVLNSVVNPALDSSMTPQAAESINPMQLVITAATVIWIIGVVGMLLYAAISYIRIRLRVREAVKDHDNIYLCDAVSSPFILGIFRPKIYLPSSIREEHTVYVIAHEQAHIKRLDHIWKPLGFLLLSIYWFHPLLWVSYILLSRDIEFACDERVLREMGDTACTNYSDALISCAAPQKHITICPLAFGESGVKKRIVNILNYKKPAFWIILIALVACIVTAVCFLTNPPQDEPPSTSAPQLGKDMEILSVSSTHDAVDIDVVSLQIQDGHHILTVRWNNRSDATIRYGQCFSAECKHGETWHPLGNHATADALNIPVLPLATEDQQRRDANREHAYGLLDIVRITSEGTYRFTTHFTYGDDSATLYEIQVTFSVGNLGVADMALLDENVQYDYILYDIDGDGASEMCYFGRGFTSGIFSFHMTVYATSVAGVGELKYRNSFYHSPFYSAFRFVVSDGELLAEGTCQQSPDNEIPTTHLYHITLLEDGRIRLTRVDDPSIILE